METRQDSDAQGSMTGRGLALIIFTLLLQVIAMTVAALYAFVALTTLILNTRKIFLLEKAALQSADRAINNALPTAPFPDFPVGTGPVEGLVGEFGSLTQIVTIVICIFAIIFLVFVVKIWIAGIESRIVATRAWCARSRSFWQKVVCVLRWALVVIEIIVFVLLLLSFIYYLLINLVSVVVVIGWFFGVRI